MLNIRLTILNKKKPFYTIERKYTAVSLSTSLITPKIKIYTKKPISYHHSYTQQNKYFLIFL